MPQGVSTFGDKWKTLIVGCKGGLNLNQDTLTLAQSPGGAVQLINYEPSKFGGYRRINGYSKFDSTAVTGSGDIIGINVFNGGVIACRGTNVYSSTGSGWSAAINTSARTAAVRYRFVNYNWNGTPRTIMVDEANYAARWDGTTYTLLNAAGAPANAKYVEEFNNHIFYAGYSSNSAEVTWCVPNNETSFLTADGAGALVAGNEITGLKKFRDVLIVFCRNKIMKITGTSRSNFAMVPVTANIGCISPDSIQEIAGDLVFLSPDGIRPLAATERIDDIEISTISRPIQPLIPTVLSSTNVCSVVVRDKSQYRLFYNSSSATASDSLGIVGAIVSRQINNAPEHSAGYGLSWEWGELMGFRPTVCVSGYIDNDEYVLHGEYDGYIYRQEHGTNMNGSNINATYRTPPLFFDDPAMRKVLHKLDVYYRVEGTFTVNVNIIYDFGSSLTLQPTAFTITEGSGLVTYGSSSMTYGASGATYGGQDQPESKNNVHGSGYTAQVKFNSNGTSLSHTIQGYKIQYLLSGRR